MWTKVCKSLHKKFLVRDFYSRCEQFSSFLWIFLHLPKKLLKKSFFVICNKFFEFIRKIPLVREFKRIGAAFYCIHYRQFTQAAPSKKNIFKVSVEANNPCIKTQTYIDILKYCFIAFINNFTEAHYLLK